MAQIFIDGQERKIDITDTRTLGDIFYRIAEAVEDSGRVMASAALDGSTLAEEETKERMDLPADAVSRIDVDTLNHEGLAIDTLDTMAEYLGRLNPELLRIAGLWRVGNDMQANDAFVVCVEGLRWFRHSIELSRLALPNDFKRITAEVRPLHTLEEQFDRTVDDMLSAQSEADWILMADLVEYELHPNLEGWMGAIQKITTEAQA